MAPISVSRGRAKSKQHAPLYPRYQVAGREPLDSLAWRHHQYGMEDQYDARPCRISLAVDVTPEPAQRSRLESASIRFLSANDLAAPARKLPTRAGNSRDEAVSHDATSEESANEPVEVPAKKRKRYLRDVDRRSIIQRIDNGEKQAALAREYGVTRAAICHMKRNREEIVTRCKSLLASAKDQTIKDKVAQIVRELTQPSVQLLLTTVRDVMTSPQIFRASANRLMMLLLEEALASAATVSATVCTTAGQMICGLKSSARSLCCVAVGEKGWPLVEVYRKIQPDGLIGGVALVTSKNGTLLHRLDLARNVTENSSFLLVSVSSATGERLCTSVQALQQRGIALESIQIVVVVTTVGAVDRVTRQFPGVRILACAIETPTRRAPRATTLSDFLDRYDALDRKPSVDISNAKHAGDEAPSQAWISSSDYERWLF